MKFFFDKAPLNSVDEAILRYKPDEFASPFRSTVPLLAWLKHEQASVCSLFRELGMPADCTLHLEYTVDPPKGKGRASHTDLMVLAGDSSLAIEAKWTEPRYEKVGKWLGEGTNKNKRDVLDGWLGLIQEKTGRNYRASDFSDAVYQMVHRAASACKSGTNPRLAYLIFEPSHEPFTASTQQIEDDLQHFWNKLGKPQKFPFYLIKQHLEPTKVFDILETLPKDQTGTVLKVCEALLGDQKLFEFHGILLTRISDLP